MALLFLRALSNGLQALLPVAAGAAWFAAGGRQDRARSVLIGGAAGIVLTWPAASLYAASLQQGQWDAALAVAAALAALYVIVKATSISRLTLAAVSGIIVIRQAILPIVVIRALLGAPGSSGTGQVVAALAIALVVAALWFAFTHGLPAAPARTATLTIASLYIAQTAFFAIHRASELGLMPSAHTVEAVTEPYGPDGFYGPYITLLIAASAFLAGGFAAWRSGVAGRRVVAMGAAALTALGAAPIAAAWANQPPALPAATVPAATTASSEPATDAADIVRITSAPHILYRTSRMDATYGRLAVTALDAPGREVVASSLACDRVSFGGGVGVCLHADRGVRTTLEAVLVDNALRQTKSIPLQGEPSRTRVSRDGRYGAFTVFLAGTPHGYTMTGFSTATVLLNMREGALIGNLEEFGALRNGRPFKAPDFNFWGVTFAPDSDTFYATLQTGGVIFLVRGSVAQRTLTVLRQGVECPSLSPDGKRIAYKQRVSASPVQWRLRVLDAATLNDHAIEGETRSVDDQLEWLDTSHVLYAIQRPGQPARDVWIASIDGAEPARVFLREAESPIVVREVVKERAAR